MRDSYSSFFSDGGVRPFKERQRYKRIISMKIQLDADETLRNEPFQEEDAKKTGNVKWKFAKMARFTA